MKQLSILLIALCLSFAGYSQTAASYGFTPLAGTFTSISGTGTSSTAISTDDATQSSIPIGFSFTYCGTPYTSLSACSNGWISLVNATSVTWSNSLANAGVIGGGVGFLMPFWDDLSGSAATVYYQTTGTAPNRIFTFEWSNWHTLGSSLPLLNMQVKLYETTNVIDYVYGASSGSGSSATIGITNSGTDYQTLPNSSTVPAPSSTTFTTSISTFPASGQIYRWTPPVACTGTPTAGSTISNITTAGSCDAITLALSGSSIATGLTYQWQSSPDGTTWTNIAGATNATTTQYETATTYYHCIVTCTSSSSSATSTSVTVTYTGICFCTPSYYYTSPATFDAMSNFTCNGYSGSVINDNGPTVIPASGYENRLPISIDFLQGGTYAGSLTYTTSWYEYDMQIWIDFNDNGVFEISEEVTPVSGLTGCVSTGTSGTFTVTIPAGAAVGIHRMRVRQAEVYNCTPEVHMDPCNPTNGTYTYYYGVTRDYNANIIAPCPFTTSAPATATTCPNAPFTLSGTTTATSYTWSGPGGFTSTSLSPTVPGITAVGIYTFSATNGTCTTNVTTSVSLLTAPPAPVVTPSVATICNGNTVTLTAAVPPANVNLIPDEGWESGVPTTPGTLVDGWNTDATSTGYITSVSSGSFPTAIPHSGSSFADFHSWSYSTAVASLISPSFSMTGITGGTISFWVWRDFGSFYTGTSYATEGWTVAINTTGSMTGATTLGFVPRTADQPTTGSVVGASTTTASGWQLYTVSIPASFSGATNYVMFQGFSDWGNDCYLDDVSITGLQNLAPPTWSPVTNLYSNAALTTPATTTDTLQVAYVHPTSVFTPTVTSYIATVTNGVCTSSDTSVVTINPGVSAIGGLSTLCVAASTTLTNTVTGGTWSSANTSIATINPTTGVVTGVTAGVDTIFYTALGGCIGFTTITITTYATPNTGNTLICNGGFTTTLSNPSTGGYWSAGASSVASVNSSTGVVTSGVAGTAIITYTTPWGCIDTSLITVLAPPTAITGLAEVCYNGGFTTLASTPVGGSWTSSDPTVASVDAASGVVTGYTSGAATITYTYIPGCFATVPLTMKSNPAPISGTAAVCESGSVTTLTDVTPGGTWSAAATTNATINATTGAVTGIAAGSVVITYTAPNNCYITTSVTVNPLPAPVTGTFAVCQTNTVTLYDATPGGSWTSGATSIATAAAGGVVGGIAAGTAPITYTLPTGCIAVANVLVNQIPAPIAGNDYVCNGYTTLFTDAVAGGSWSSSPAANATVDGAGTVHGVSVGTATVTYTTGSGSCFVTKPVTISPVASPVVSITASTGTTVCAGTPVTFTPTVSGAGSAPLYVWSVNNVILSGATSYSYTPANNDIVRLWVLSNYACSIPDSSSALLTMTVNPIVTPSVSLSIAGGDTVCLGSPTVINANPVAGGSAPVYTWTKNLVPVTAGSFYSYTPANGDVITVTVTSNAPCRTASTASATKIITVSPYVTPLVTMSSSFGSTACDGYPEVFNATQINGGYNPTYQWMVNGVNTVTGPTYTYAPANGDLVQVVLTSSFPCVSTPTSTANQSMTVLPITQPVGVVSAVPGYIVAPGMNDTFTVTILSGGGLAPTYQWYTNSVPVPGATNTVFIASSLHTGDSVSCEVTNTDQCSGVAIFNYINVTVGYNVGVHQINKAGATIAVVPNPNNGAFNVKATLGVLTDEDVNMEITDMLGQVVFSKTAHAVNGELNEQVLLGGNLASGSYILNVHSEHISKVFHFVLAQ